MSWEDNIEVEQVSPEEEAIEARIESKRLEAKEAAEKAMLMDKQAIAKQRLETIATACLQGMWSNMAITGVAKEMGGGSMSLVYASLSS